MVNFIWIPRLRRAALGAVALLVVVVASGCAETLILDTPGDDVLFYQPRSMANMNNTTVLLVNSNFDKRFASGWISAIDVAQIVQAATVGGNGVAAVSRPLLVPRLGGRMAFNTIDPQTQPTRAFLPHAGSGILTVLDIEYGPSGLILSCGDTDDRSNLPTDLANTSCDRFHLVDLIDQAWQQDTTRKQSDFSDPAAVAYLTPPGVDETLLVGYLGVSWVSTLTLATSTDPTSARIAAANLSAPTFQSPLGSIRHFTPSVLDGAQAYASGSTATGSAIVPLNVVSGQQLVSSNLVDLSAPTGGSVVERSLVSPVDANVVYVLNRVPDEIVTFKRITRPVGLVSAQTPAPSVAATLQLQPEIVSIDGSQPFDLVYAQRSVADVRLGDIVAVVGVAKNTVYFLEPGPTGLHLVGRLPLESDVILTSSAPALAGGGPGGIAYVNARAFGDTYKDLLFVSNYFSHTLSVIDISSQSPAAFKEVLRIEGNNLGPSLRYP